VQSWSLPFSSQAALRSVVAYAIFGVLAVLQRNTAQGVAFGREKWQLAASAVCADIGPGRSYAHISYHLFPSDVAILFNRFLTPRSKLPIADYVNKFCTTRYQPQTKREEPRGIDRMLSSDRTPAKAFRPLFPKNYARAVAGSARKAQCATV
jgi:hypothetical protein